MTAELNEDSPLTLQGSFSKDLIFSKMWLCHYVKIAMERLGISKFDEILIIGAWYGNMALMIDLYDIQFDRLFINDIDPTVARMGERLLRPKFQDRFKIIVGDANRLQYDSIDRSRLVINTSCNDIDGEQWFYRIPRNCLLAIQSRSDHETLQSFRNRCPMTTVMFSKSKSFQDPSEQYDRHMIIGIR